MYKRQAYGLGSVRSYIREVFEYGRQQAKIVGEENVFDYSLGNPSIPAPEKVNETIINILNTESSIKAVSYTHLDVYKRQGHNHHRHPPGRQVET